MSRRQYPPENDLLLPVLRGVIRLGWAGQMTPAAVEVPWHQKRVDLAVLPDASSLIAIELKVAKWRQAVDQAYVNRWASTSSFVAIWHQCITLDTYSYATSQGVGLLAVTENTVYPLLDAAPAPRPVAGGRLVQEVVRGRMRLRDLLSDARGAALALA